MRCGMCRLKSQVRRLHRKYNNLRREICSHLKWGNAKYTTIVKPVLDAYEEQRRRTGTREHCCSPGLFMSFDEPAANSTNPS